MLNKKCLNNQAEQLTVLQALEKLEDMNGILNNQRKCKICINSKVAIDLLRNSTNHNAFVQRIREKLRMPERNYSTVQSSKLKLIWYYWKWTCYQLTKGASKNINAKTSYNKLQKNSIIAEETGMSLEKWQTEWEKTNKDS